MNKGKLAVRCRDCGTIRMVWKRELNHAARPRCLACGGPVELSQQGSEQRALGQNARNFQRFGRH